MDNNLKIYLLGGNSVIGNAILKGVQKRHVNKNIETFSFVRNNYEGNTSENIIKVALIPHTLEWTNLNQKNVGDSLNIETDIIGKYIERLMTFEEDEDQIDDFMLKNLKNWEFGES